MAPTRPDIYIDTNNIEIYECTNCQYQVVKHWVEDSDEAVFDKPTLFVGSLPQVEDILSKLENKETKEAEQDAARDAGVEEENKSGNALYKISKISGTSLYTIYYDTPLKAIHTPERGERLIMDLGAKLLEINEKENVQLEHREDFLNYEATRIVDLDEEELSKRIQKYGDILFSSRIFQNACMVRLKKIILESRREFDLETLKQEKKAKRKVTAKAPDDKMYIQLAKVFGWTTESGEYDIERVKTYIAENKGKENA